MTRDDIIRMASEVGIFMHSHKHQEHPTKLERFANLVAAAEREACARVCEEVDRRWINQADRCAERIRDRGKNDD